MEDNIETVSNYMICLLVVIIVSLVLLLISWYIRKLKLTDKTRNTIIRTETINNTSYEPDINNIFDYTGEIWRGNPNIK